MSKISMLNLKKRHVLWMKMFVVPPDYLHTCAQDASYDFLKNNQILNLCPYCKAHVLAYILWKALLLSFTMSHILIWVQQYANVKVLRQMAELK